MEGPQKRQTAYKVSIATITNGRYIKNTGWEPNYLEVGREKISRVNVIGIAVGINQNGNYETLYLDDGSGKISVRSFENPSLFIKIQIGDILIVVGKPREFNNEIYLIPEIVKKINNKKWIDVRVLELQKSLLEKEVHNEEVEEEEIKDEKLPEKNTNKVSSMELVYNLIKEMDGGQGADYETIIEKAGPSSIEIIEKLLKEGEIFEVAAGKLKIL